MLDKKNLLLSFAVICSLGLTACGEKKDVFAGGEESQPEVQTASDQTQDRSAKRSSSTVGGGLETGGVADLEPIGPSVGKLPPPPTPPKETITNPGGSTAPATPAAPSAPVSGGTPSAPAPSQPAAPAQPTVVVQPENGRPLPLPQVADVAPTVGLGMNPIPMDYKDTDYTQILRDGLSKRLTGAMTSDGLVYTSSSTDELHEYLRLRNEGVGAYQKQLNYKLASTVESAVLSVDSFTKDVVVTLRIKEGNNSKVYNFAGGVEDQGNEASTLKLVREGNGKKTTGTQPVEGTVKCLDIDGLCENVLVRIKVGPKSNAGIVNVVFRQSKASLYFHLKEDTTKNPEYLVLEEMMRNTVNGKSANNALSKAEISSWEVVNGRSGFTVKLKTFKGELLGFSGPLLAPEAGSSVRINLSRLAKDKEDSLDWLASGNDKFNFANSIGEARLINNNGLGQIRIAFKVRRSAAYQQDQFAITFMRKIKPIVDLYDEELGLK